MNKKDMLDLMTAVRFCNPLYLSDELLQKSIDFTFDNPDIVEKKLKSISPDKEGYYRSLAKPDLIYLTIINNNQIIGEKEYDLMLQEANEEFKDFPFTRSIETTYPDVTCTHTHEIHSGQILYNLSFSRLIDSFDFKQITKKNFSNAEKMLNNLQKFNLNKNKLLEKAYRLITFYQSGFFEHFDKARMIQLSQKELSERLETNCNIKFNQSKLSRLFGGRHIKAINKRGESVAIYTNTLFPTKNNIKRYHLSGALNNLFLEEMEKRVAYSDRVLAEKTGTRRRLVAKIREEAEIPNHCLRQKEYTQNLGTFYTIDY